MLTIIVLVFDLGMSFGEVMSEKARKKVGKGLKKAWKFMLKTA